MSPSDTETHHCPHITYVYLSQSFDGLIDPLRPRDGDSSVSAPEIISKGLNHLEIPKWWLRRFYCKKHHLAPSHLYENNHRNIHQYRSHQTNSLHETILARSC